MQKRPEYLVGLFQAVGLIAYVLLIVTLLNNLGMEDKNVPEILAGVSMLLLFVVSALISASIVLGHPFMLFWNGHRGEAYRTVFWTVVWVVVFLSIVLAKVSMQ